MGYYWLKKIWLNIIPKTIKINERKKFVDNKPTSVSI